MVGRKKTIGGDNMTGRIINGKKIERCKDCKNFRHGQESGYCWEAFTFIRNPESIPDICPLERCV